MRQSVQKTKGGIVYPQVERALKKLGEDISYARRIRHISAAEFAERAGIGRATLHRLERGDPGIALNTLAMALHVLGRLNALTDIIDASSDHVGLMQMKTDAPQRIVKSRSRAGQNNETSKTERGIPPVSDKKGFVGF
ncbi:helix-turn-helix domain-containing protein [Thalassospira xianhensis]|uniref:HTH cro/C1-type domain-containing protein n=1 Tax=Thalassospira xianhensis MCCC 1A02616 TaxID=1177929 RepID=A0A367U775_9PROT|nr:helix-turn-helix transcriptional regulator [Thalassospira xianhensis]RCK04145.1 hypothetical protein TH5_21440 [Thalassospira xianhensis MCCC 1A02616]